MTLTDIESALREAHISDWLIRDTVTEGIELYFIKHELDMRRSTRVQQFAVTVFRDFEEDGKKYRGSSAVLVPDGTDRQGLLTKLKDAYYSASLVKNLWYPLPQAETCREPAGLTDFACTGWKGAAMELAAAAFAAEDSFSRTHPEGSFLNSMEIFSKRSQVHLVHSGGTDVSYVTCSVNGEFVAQCRTPQDVESYESFSYDKAETEALCQLVTRTLERTGDRAAATRPAPAGRYRLILSGSHVATLMEFFTERSEASLVYQGFSRWQLGDMVQQAGSDQPVAGDLLQATLTATEPYSQEGILMKDRILLEDGVLRTWHGSARMCYYLKAEPTGSYRKLTLRPGKRTLEELRQTPYLYVVSFSDFQTDSMTGSFGGEIRLAYWFDGNQVTPVTGGSVNGNMLEAQRQLIFSSDTQTTRTFDGPYAVSIDNVTVAGAAAEA